MRLRTAALSAVVASTVAFAPVLAGDIIHVEVERPDAPSTRNALAAALEAAPVTTAGQPPALGPVSDSFELVGHHDLGARGMNAALAIHEGHAYVGSRTDGKSVPGVAENVNDAGILVIDVSDPADMERVGEIGLPHQALTDQTSREMRVWPERDLLIVTNLSSNCSELIHMCAPFGGPPDTFDFYDISEPADPVHVAQYDPTNNPHEFYLWVDPADPEGRALLYVSGTSSNSFYVTDISDYDAQDPAARFRELGILDEVNSPNGGDLHSMTPDFDGRTTYLANLTGGLGVMDTSDFVAGEESPEFRQHTNPVTAPTWSGPGAHSALRVPGRDLTIVADEVYGDALKALGDHGCPWGWVRFFDTSRLAQPEQVGEFRLPVNEEEFCATDVPRPSSSYSAHNPTVTDELLFISWHAGGLRVISFDDPKAPVEEGAFIPEPLQAVAQEDPALTAGQDKVAFWSFPIISDGIVYVVDVRNGLYALEYTGRDHEDVAGIDFLEGNSNVGDAARYALLDEEG